MSLFLNSSTPSSSHLPRPLHGQSMALNNASMAMKQSPDTFAVSARKSPHFGAQQFYTGPYNGLNFFTDFNDGTSDKEALNRFNDVLKFVEEDFKTIEKHLTSTKAGGPSVDNAFFKNPETEKAHKEGIKLHQRRAQNAIQEGRSGHLDIQNFQDIPYGDIQYANLALQRLAGRTNQQIHVHVTDPGVGNAVDAQGKPMHDRSILVTKNHGVLIGPNNGSLSLLYKSLQAVKDESLELLRIDLKQVQELERLRLKNPDYKVPDTFHARDAFAVVAAAIAGGLHPHLLGEKRPDFKIRETPFAKELHDLPLKAGVETNFHAVRDRTFGNIKTNLRLAHDDMEKLVKEKAAFKVHASGDKAVTELPFKSFFSQVDPGKPLAYLGSTYAPKTSKEATAEPRLVELALNLGNISEKLGIQTGESKPFKIHRFK